MNPEGLLQHFDTISEAPDAVARLRRLILDLAVRGKLVEQDAGDEPASDLLNRIAAQRRSEKSKPSPGANCMEVATAAFDLPRSWAWTTLGAVARYGNANKVNSNVELAADAWVLDLEDIEKETGRLLSRVAADTRAFQSAKTRFDCGDVLFGKLRPYLCKIIVATEPGVCTTEIVPVGPLSGISPHYVQLVLRSPLTMRRVDQLMYGVKMPRLGTADANALAFPLPPSAEQHRIAAKVDELMGLCDQLQAARDTREQQRDRLVAASLHRLAGEDATDGGDVAELGACRAENARFHLEHLPRLSTRHEHITQLRQTILNLAVRGRLVRQDNIDESVAALLEKLYALATVSSSKKASAPADLTRKESETHSATGLPVGWQYISLGDVCPLITSGSRGWAEFYSKSGPEFIRAQNIRFGVLNLSELAHVNPPNRAEGARTLVARGDLLMVITGAGVTNAGLVEHEIKEAYVSQHVALIRPADSKLSRWLLLCLMAPDASRSEIVERAYGSGKPGLNLENIRSLRLPLPPLSEQHRIVAKVDELMALCDQLEARLASTRADRTRLLDSLLHEAMTPALQSAA